MLRRVSSATAKIFTDGSCIRNGQSNAAMGIGIHWPNAPENNISEPYYSDRATNQRAELEAARRGIQQCKQYGYRNVIIFTDSHYVMKGVTEWMPRWDRDGYVTSSGDPVINANDFRSLKLAMDGIKVQFEYVPSSENHADKLAKDAAHRAQF